MTDNPNRHDDNAREPSADERPCDLSGILVLDKPSGPSSHSVVAAIRSASRVRRVGHAGTLDPLATGVLVVFLGTATRLAEWATGDDKRYRATIALGVSTTTYDAAGEVTERRPVDVTWDDVANALGRFLGEIEQHPPAYSAIQVGGRRLYALARSGVAVELRPRLVTIRRLDIIDWSSPEVTIELTCSKGTYVRSIAHDLGQALGCGGHLSALRRLASGGFTIDESTPLEQAVAAFRAGSGGDVLYPPERAVAAMPRIDLDQAEALAIGHGLPIRRSASVLAGAAAAGGLARAHSTDGALKAIVEWREDGWWPKKVLR